VKHAVAFNSCTSALQLAIEASSLNGEIILPSFTFVASANAIVTAGCKPIFVDIDPHTFNIDVSNIESAITDQTVAIMPIHFAGQSAEMSKIMEIADRHNLLVIEDSAEAIGATFKSKKTGSFGIGCFSFFPTKNMTCGEGGMLTTNDDELAEKVKTFRGHGIKSSSLERDNEFRKPWERIASLAGYNYRMSDILAAVGIEQLKKLDSLNKRRREIAEYFNNALSLEELQLPTESTNCKHVYQMYVIKVSKSIYRDKFVSSLRSKGIGASVHFDPPAHKHPYYIRRYGEKILPITEEVSKSVVSLPMYPQLTTEQLNTIISKVKESLLESKQKLVG